MRLFKCAYLNALTIPLSMILNLAQAIMPAIAIAVLNLLLTYEQHKALDNLTILKAK